MTSPCISLGLGNSPSPPESCPPNHETLQRKFTLKVMNTSKSPRGQGFPLEMLMIGESQM